MNTSGSSGGGQNQASGGGSLEQTLSNTRGLLDQLISQVRSDISSTEEPKAQALFETTAEVLIGLRKAYEDYSKGGERAWQ